MNKKTYIASLIIVTVIHFFVDFLCSNSLSHIENITITGVIGYNLLAFVFQLPLGYILDKVYSVKNSKRFGAVGIVLVACGSLICSPLLLGLGNAFVHIFGSGIVYSNYQNKSKYAGIYVSSGAIGLFLGLNYKIDVIWGTIIMLLLLPLLLLIRVSYSKMKYEVELTNKNIFICLLIFVVIVIRSYTGFLLVFPWKANIYLSLISVIFGVSLGKVLGGFLLDKWGLKIAPISLAISIPCVIPQLTFLNIIGICLFNITMPITLFLLVQLFPNRRNTMFGVTTTFLFIGGIFYLGYSEIQPFILIIISAILFVLIYILKNRKYITKIPKKS